MGRSAGTASTGRPPLPPAAGQGGNSDRPPLSRAAQQGGNSGRPPLPSARPTRADARRNYDLLVAAAREAFAEHGTETSLEEIARRAGVGIGTLYRRFPNRTALLEAVYVDEIQSVCDRAYGFAEELGPFEALAAWLRSFLTYNLSKRSLAGELTVALGKDSEFFRSCKLNVKDAGELLLNRAKEAGEVRPELELMDIMCLVGGITMGRDLDREQAERMLDIVLSGLRPPGTAPAKEQAART